MRKFRTPFWDFSFKIVGSYIVWKILLYLLDTTRPVWWSDFKEWVSSITVDIAYWCTTHWLHYTVVHTSRNLIPDGAKGIFVADHCLGLPVMFVFILFISIYQGPWWHKLWFIPAGVFSIILINAIRIVGLLYLQRNASEFYFYLNHSYFYLIVYYGFIFMMIVWWVERFADVNPLLNERK